MKLEAPAFVSGSRRAPWPMLSRAVARHNDEIVLSDTAGLIQMSFEGEPKVLSEKLLDGYYNRGKN